MLSIRQALGSLPHPGHAVIVAASLLSIAAHAQAPAIVGARSVFGANSYLADGATELMLGRYERGVALTRLGLKDILSVEERATAYSNLCGGYIGLKEYETARVYCNRSLELLPANWRALQNRAAVHIQLNDIEAALQDVEQGLALNPDNESLKLTLALAREHERRLTRQKVRPARTPS